MVILGIDQSLSCSGLCLLKDGKIIKIGVAETKPNIIDFSKGQTKEVVTTLYNRFPEKKRKLLELHDDCIKLTIPKSKLTKVDKKLLRMPFDIRSEYILKQIQDFVGDVEVDIVVNESISFGSAGQVATLGQLLGKIQGFYLGKFGCITRDVAPTSLKAFAGKGNYSKDEMYEALTPENQLLVDGYPEKKKDDIVDAMWLAIYGHEVLNG